MFVLKYSSQAGDPNPGNGRPLTKAILACDSVLMIGILLGAALKDGKEC